MFAVLGPLSVIGPDGQVLTPPPGKRRRLLAALLRRRNDWVEIDVLAEALWDRAEYPSSVSGSIKTYVHQLRKALPPTADGQRLAGQGGAYRLTVQPGELDADIFESLVRLGADALARGEHAEAIRLQRRALELWRGDPDEDTTDPVTARHLEEIRWTARYCLADGLLAAGESAEAIAMLRTLLSEDPLREAGWERLITAQRAAGWQVDALASYEEARLVLLEKFGAEPGTQLQRIYRLLLAETVDEAVPSPPRRTAEPRPAVAAPTRRWATSVPAILVAGLLFLVGGSSAASQREPAVAPPPSTPLPKIVFGLGPSAVAAGKSPLMSAGIGMVTTWYHGPNQLAQFEGWRADLIPATYRSGRAMHLVVATWQDPTSIDTRFGRACGQPYPLSAEFLADMRRLARAFAGEATGPPLYVSMFHGLQKLSCANTGYLADRATTNYYLALRDRYFEVMKIMRSSAPNIRIALNWDGWTASYDQPDIGAGRSMFPYFVEAMRASDFQSFSAFETDGNAEHIRQMVKALGVHGPVLLAYYGPHEDPVDVYLDDLRKTFTPEALAQLVADGLFAFSFRDDDLLRANPPAMTLAAQVVRDYGQLRPGGG